MMVSIRADLDDWRHFDKTRTSLRCSLIPLTFFNEPEFKEGDEINYSCHISIEKAILSFLFLLKKAIVC